jgi:hypothetical protein
MPLTRGYTDEIKELNAEPIIGSAVGELLDDTVTRIAKHIDIPLRLYASATPDQYLNIGASKIEAGDGAGKVTPPVDSALPVIAGGQIGFTAKTAPAFVKIDGAAFSFPTTTAGEFRRLAFSVDGLGNLNAVWSVASATVVGLTDPGLLHVQMAGVPVGYIDLEALAAAGTYKTAGSATDVIENKAGSDIRIFRYGSGSGSGGAGGGASLLDPNYDESFIYYTRSDFAIDKKTFFGSTDGTENILGLGKIVLDTFDEFVSANLLGPVFLADNPVINTAQVRLLYAVGKVDTANGSSYVFTIPESSISAGAVYTIGDLTFTVSGTTFSHVKVYCTGSGNPPATGTLTKTSGTGPSTLAYTAWKPGIGVSTDGGSTWRAPYQTEVSGRFVVADFVLPEGTTSSDTRVCVVSKTINSELNGFGVNLVQDNTGSYAGDANAELRTITPTEATTGTITLTQVRFTPGASQLHASFSGHDFIAPTAFLELGGGVVQFAANFFTAGDVVKFYVGYGLVKEGDAAITINNVISANTTMGSLQIPTGFTLDKPYMEIPLGSTVSGAGNVSTDKAITGAGVLATTGTVLSRGVAPTQPKYDRIEEATSGKGVAIRGRSDGGMPGPGDVGETIFLYGVRPVSSTDNGWRNVAFQSLPYGIYTVSFSTLFDTSGLTWPSLIDLYISVKGSATPSSGGIPGYDFSEFTNSTLTSGTYQRYSLLTAPITVKVSVSGVMIGPTTSAGSTVYFHIYNNPPTGSGTCSWVAEIRRIA